MKIDAMMGYEDDYFYKNDTETRMGVYTSADGNITEQDRVIQSANGLWFCQSRFYYKVGNCTTRWQIVKVYKTEEEAKRYFAEMPDWVKEF